MESLFEATFSSLKEAIDACNAAARAEGSALAIRSKKPSALDPKHVYLRCSKGRAWFNQGNEALHDSRRRPQTTTQMTNCRFRLSIHQDKGSETWKVISEHRVHNHDLSAASSHRKYRTEAVSAHRQEIIDLYNNGTKPFFIATQLRARGRQEENADLVGIKNQDICNILARHRNEQLAGRTPLQYLYDLLDDSDFFYRDARDSANRLKGLFIAPKSGIDLYRQYPSVLLLDCTYKTN